MSLASPTRRLLLALAAAFATGLGTAPALADNGKPIKLLVGFRPAAVPTPSPARWPSDSRMNWARP